MEEGGRGGGRKMKELNCAKCETTIYLTDETYQRRREDGGQFFCQNGHANVFSESEVQRLKRSLDWNIKRCDVETKTVVHLRNAVNGYKGQIAKLKKKIKAMEEENEKKAENVTGEGEK